MAKEHLYTFKGMPGVRAKQLRGPMVSTVSGFMTALRKHRYVADAGDHGAISVYCDDDGNYRCSFQVFRSPQAGDIFKTKREVRAWLVKWLPAQRERIAA